MVKFFDFDDKELEQAYLEEGFISDVQIDIVRMLSEKHVSRSELARRLKVSPASVTQMLGDGGANLTSRTIARAYLALNEEAAICTKRELKKLREMADADSKPPPSREVVFCGIPVGKTRWREDALQDTGSEKLAENDNLAWLANYQKKRA
jgi:DNA-binding transcriptional ArsR family regulator